MKDVGNAAYETKRKAYGKSAFSITRVTAERYGHWDEQKVIARQKGLATMTASIWQICFGG